MSTAEKIFQYLKKLPEIQKIKVLEFIENLDGKSDCEITARDNDSWQNLSLSMAMRGMEDEDQPDYTAADLREVFNEKSGANSSF